MTRARSLRFPYLLTAFVLAAGCAPGDAGGGEDETPAPSPSAGPTPAPQPCQPSAGGPYWLREGESVTFRIACETGFDPGPDAFKPEFLPPGAAFDATTATFSWTPGLDAAAVYRIRLDVLATGESGRVTVGVADRFDDPDNVPVLDPTKYTEELGLPVFFLSPGPTDDDEWAPTTIVYRGHTYVAEAKKRGVTSLDYPKNSYSLRFDKEDEFNDPERGFDDVRRMALTQTFDDNSYLRNRLAFELWNRLDPEHVQIRTFSAVVFVDGEYWGLYTVSDFVNDELMGDNGLGEDGNLYKARSHEANWDVVYEGLPKTSLHAGFEKTEGTPMHGESGAYDDLDELVEFVGTADDDTFREEIGDRIDLRDYRDWWIFVRFIHASDSAGKNSFHYHPVGGLWRYIPWDFNASFGQSWQTNRRPADASDDFAYRNRIFERLLSDPDLYAQVDAEYRQALQGPWKLEELLSLYDGLVAEIAPSARRDETKWGEVYRSYDGWSHRTDFTSFEEEAGYVRQWLVDRWDNEQSAH